MNLSMSNERQLEIRANVGDQSADEASVRVPDMYSVNIFQLDSKYDSKKIENMEDLNMEESKRDDVENVDFNLEEDKMKSDGDEMGNNDFAIFQRQQTNHLMFETRDIRKGKWDKANE